MPSQPDLTVYSSDHQLQLVVEIKRVSGKGPEWAAELHRNLLEYHAVPPSPFFLLVLPDHLYLWSTQQGEDAYLPQYEAVTTSALKKYLPKKAHYSNEITELGLQLAMQFWLSELTIPMRLRMHMNMGSGSWNQDCSPPFVEDRFKSRPWCDRLYRVEFHSSKIRAGLSREQSANVPNRPRLDKKIPQFGLSKANLQSKKLTRKAALSSYMAKS